jgi:hypothetical protein
VDEGGQAVRKELLRTGSRFETLGWGTTVLKPKAESQKPVSISFEF